MSYMQFGFLIALVAKIALRLDGLSPDASTWGGGLAALVVTFAIGFQKGMKK